MTKRKRQSCCWILIPKLAVTRRQNPTPYSSTMKESLVLTTWTKWFASCLWSASADDGRTDSWWMCSISPFWTACMFSSTPEMSTHRNQKFYTSIFSWPVENNWSSNMFSTDGVLVPEGMFRRLFERSAFWVRKKNCRLMNLRLFSFQHHCAVHSVTGRKIENLALRASSAPDLCVMHIGVNSAKSVLGSSQVGLHVLIFSFFRLHLPYRYFSLCDELLLCICNWSYHSPSTYLCFKESGEFCFKELF